MLVEQAHAVAQEWVEQYASHLAGFQGAYLSGSFVTASSGESWPRTSDIDIVVITGGEPPEKKPGKFPYRGALLEVTLIPMREYASKEHILSTHYLAFELNAGVLLADPMGWLHPLHEQVKAEYGKEQWVLARCHSFIDRIQSGVNRFDPNAPFHEQVTQWLFPTGITAFPILAAALKNCTVRKRYTAARLVLETYGLMDFYKRLIGLLTGGSFSPDRLPGHMAELETTFDMAGKTAGPSSGYPFRSDIRPFSRPVAINGCRDLLASPYPAEAIFWMAATFARCHAILSMDAPGLHAQRLPAFRAFMAEIGIPDPTAFPARNKALLTFLPEVEATAGIILQKRALLK